MEEKRSRYERNRKKSTALDADILDVKKPTLLWTYWSNYQNIWYVTGFLGKY